MPSATRSVLPLLPLLLINAAVGGGELRGVIVDADTQQSLPARVYLRSADGTWYFARSADEDGSAVEYRKQRGETSVEMHTTLSAHQFLAELPPGTYEITVERGKEYLPLTEQIEIGEGRVERELRLKRWIDVSKRGWYSGDTHVHRTLDELPNAMLAEDLNVALPLTYWVTQAYTPPTRGNKNTGERVSAEIIKVDDTHVIYPINTEYEIFTVNERRHTLGAVFVLNHKQPLSLPTPPVKPIAVEARKQGALLDLDKHSWPWSLMLVPVMDVDLFELSNNHIWRTEFFFSNWTAEMRPKFMQLDLEDEGWTEQTWMHFGFETYYTLLNCGFRMRPTAGTASGVHPVPLGFGRVYVHLPDGFNYKSWIKGLDAGRSFVTTGPMLFAAFNDLPPGEIFKVDGEGTECRVTGTVESARALERIEVIVNGEVATVIKPQPQRTEAGAYSSQINTRVPIEQSSWVAVRCFEAQADGRLRFAHTAPVHFEVPNKPLRPRRSHVEYLVERMEQELERNSGVLQEAELEEYREALKVYQRLAENAR